MRVKIVIEKEFSEFDEHDAEIFRYALASFLRIPPASIRIIDATEGSVRIVVELPEQEADSLISAYQREDPELISYLADYPVREIAASRPERSTPAQLLAHPRLTTSGPSVIAGGRLNPLAENTVVPALAEEYESRFRQVFEQYYGAVSYYFSQSGFPAEIARDLAQKTFIDVYRGLGAFRAAEQFETWLFRIARNVARNALRAQGAMKRKVESEEFREGTDTPRPSMSFGSLDLDPLDEAIKRERTKLLRDAIDELPPRMKTVLVLRVYSDMKYREIAERLGISIGTVKSHLHQARRVLKERLDEYFDELEI